MNKFKIKISGQAKNVTLVNLEPGDTDGVAAELTVQNTEVVVDVNERPKFILVDEME